MPEDRRRKTVKPSKHAPVDCILSRLMNPNARVLFVIQGEGRGHMTQAIALKRILERNGFSVQAALIGTSSGRKIPDFVRENLDIPIVKFRSPNFVRDPEHKGLRIGATIWKDLLESPLLLGNLRIFRRSIRDHKPVLIVNFYEPLLGLYLLAHRKRARVVSVAHQYLALHPEFEHPEGNWINRIALEVFTRVTALRADLLLGLSFYPMKDDPERRLFVVPPLLREEVRKLPARRGTYLLVYLLNAGYKNEIVAWHEQRPEVELHCFTDDPALQTERRIDQTLTFHPLSGTRFLEMMADARALVSTAGFESICEGMYLGKPSLVVPVENHYEQYLNSRDAYRAGAGVYADHFDIDKLMRHLETEHAPSDRFRAWADRAEPIIIGHIASLGLPT